MKKKLTLLLIVPIVLICASAFINKSSNGFIAGYTGSPGEGTCFNCHGGGFSADPQVTVSATPSFSMDQYMPDSTYLITVQVSATGFNNFGFGCEILDSVNGNAGTMQTPGPGVHFSTAFNGRRNALHTSPKAGTNNSASFNFEWVAPHQGTVAIYACGNAVNMSGGTGGDLPIPASFTLSPLPAPVNTTVIDVGIRDNQPEIVSRITVFPNPASGLSNISYILKETKQVSIELIDIKGNVVKQLFDQRQAPGNHSQMLDLQGIASGIYFVRFSADRQKVSQKLITVH